MKITFTATVDLGDDFCDVNCSDEVKWALNCVKKAPEMRLHDVGEDYPIKVKRVEAVDLGNEQFKGCTE